MRGPTVCPQCGEELDNEDYQICPYCGESLAGDDGSSEEDGDAGTDE